MSNTTIEQKLQAIKQKALQNLTPQSDYYNQVKDYLKKIEAIREENKIHHKKETETLFNTFQKAKDDIFKSAKNDPSVKIHERLKEAYMEYAINNAKLDKIGQATIFYDAVSAMYVRISLFSDGKNKDRMRIDRFKAETIRKYIDLESNTLINQLLKSDEVSRILRHIKPYIKVFEPKKSKFFGDFFNTYVPNGFLDIDVENVLNIDKFATVTLPQRYPAINALLSNIAPVLEERLFLLNWLSTILNTAQKTRTAPILKGIQRTGKGVFTTKIIEYAMHESNCFTATNANLADKFNSYLEDKLFITFDEVKGDFNKEKDIGNKVKQIISETNMQIRSMHTNPYMITLYANCIFLLNEDLPIPMDQSDGRLTVIETKSRKLIKVAEEDFGIKIQDFIKLIEKERDEFLIHLKLCKFDKQKASGTLENNIKKAIQDATSTTQAILKTAFKNKDIETIEELLEEAIQDTADDILIKGEVEVLKELDDGSKAKVKKQIQFPFKNKEMKENFLLELQSGFLSNTSLKWFSMVTNIEHILKSDLKFGNFWNLVLSPAVIIKLKRYENRLINGNMQKIEVSKKEKFRTLNNYETTADIKEFYFNKNKYTLVASKTAVLMEQ